MCDKGILETVPDAMKLEYCITIMPELQKKIVGVISALIGQPVEITNPKQGEYPQDKEEHNRNTVTIELVDKNVKFYAREVVRFSLKELPGCCGVLVSYHVQVRKPWQGKGINSFLQEVKEEIARSNNYTILMCTTTSNNRAEIHILEKYGWKQILYFTNNRTGNTVLTYVKEVKEN